MAQLVHGSFIEDVNLRLWSEKAGSPVEAEVGYKKHVCHVCLKELIQQCANEHPEWFTKMHRHLAARHHSKALTFVAERLKGQNCLVIERPYDYDQPELVGICARHLRDCLRRLELIDSTEQAHREVDDAHG